MTARITTRPLRKPGRTPKQPPVDAAERIRELAANGASQLGIAHALGTSADTMRRWLDEFAALKEAFDQGREIERHTLHTALYRAATEQGNMTAAMFLLKSRHGYREGEAPDSSNKVAITFSLPGALPLQSFIDVSPASPTTNQP